MLSAALPLASKSGASIKDNSPVVSSIANLSLSADSPNVQVTVSSALKLCTAVVFSSMEAELVESPAFPDGPVITGFISSRSTIWMVTFVVSVFPAPSVTDTDRLYLLLLS